MKILLTGTHFTPAVAVIEELKKHDSEIKLIYVGRNTTREGDSSPSVESQIIPKLGVKFIPLIAGRLQRSFTLYTIPSLFKVPFGLVQSWWILLREHPDVVVSFGGYVGLPVVFAAWTLSIPVLVHEQTLVAGLANTISNWFANKVAVTFPTKVKSHKIVLTGNPLRSEIIHPDASDQIKQFFTLAKKAGKKVILVTGGNQGAHTINQAIEKCLDQLLEDYYVIHQTGDSSFQDFERLSEHKNPGYFVTKFITNGMGYCMKNADAAIARGGINSLIELAYYNTPAVVVPLPFVSKDEQRVNARYFSQLGLVEVIDQEQLSTENLLNALQKTLKSKTEEKKLAELIIPDAAKRISLEILLLVQR